MPIPQPLPEREQQAQREIGVTAIPRVAAAVLAASLAALLLLGTGVQLVRDRSMLKEPAGFARQTRQAWQGASGSPWHRLFAANRVLLQAMDDWETRLEDSAWFHAPLLAVGQPLLWHVGAGNGQAVRGRDGWLQYQPDVDYVTAPPFAIEPPLTAILDFQAQLAARGIRLLVVPVPVKPQVHPESLARGPVVAPLRNPSETSLMQALRQQGVAVLELAEPLVRVARTHGRAYLKTDTHWTPAAMQEAARLAADALLATGALEAVEAGAVERDTRTVTRSGDITDMLALPDSQTLIPPETVTHTRVTIPSSPPQVLLLGDSFSNIYSLEAMGWGEAGGFGEHLGAALRRPVLSLLRNDAGASATRELLALDLARGIDRLAGIRVVVWQFAMREFRNGDWRMIALDRDHRRPVEVAGSEMLEGVRRMLVSATVAEVSVIPRPGQVAYSEHVATVALRDVSSEDGTVEGGRAVARVLSMRNHQLLACSRWGPGTRVRLHLVPFAEVEARYGALNTSLLDDMDLLLVEPFWIEEVLE